MKIALVNYRYFISGGPERYLFNIKSLLEARGHEDDGTNSFLLETLASTELNLLLNVGFNKEVTDNTALYWNKEAVYLTEIIEKADTTSESEIKVVDNDSTKRNEKVYSWNLFLTNTQMCGSVRSIFI